MTSAEREHAMARQKGRDETSTGPLAERGAPPEAGVEGVGTPAYPPSQDDNESWEVTEGARWDDPSRTGHAVGGGINDDRLRKTRHEERDHTRPVTGEEA